jgi:hypothetical protein
LRTYQNAPISKDQAIDLILDAGLLAAEKDAQGRAIEGTSRMRIVANGEGYDVVMPVEHLVRLANVNFNEGRKHALDHFEAKR